MEKYGGGVGTDGEGDLLKTEGFSYKKLTVHFEPKMICFQTKIQADSMGFSFLETLNINVQVLQIYNSCKT